MKKTTLIASYDISFAAALSGELSLLDRSCVIVSAGAKAEGSYDNSDLIEIPWRPSSIASTRSSVLEALNVKRSIHEAVILGPYPADKESRSITDSFEGADRIIDERIKGFIAMVREITSYFASHDGGRIVMVHPSYESFVSSPVESAGAGAVESFAASLASLKGLEENLEIFDITDLCMQQSTTARFIAKTIDRPSDRKAQRVIRFTGKSGPFGLF
jgi:hypothetical protein